MYHGCERWCFFPNENYVCVCYLLDPCNYVCLSSLITRKEGGE